MIPGENEKKRIFENIEKNEEKSFSKFYQKWVKRERIEQKTHISRNFRISEDKIKNRRPLFDINMFKIDKNAKDEMIEERFCEDLIEKINGKKQYFNEFVFVFDKVQTKPQSMILSKYKIEVFCIFY